MSTSSRDTEHPNDHPTSSPALHAPTGRRGPSDAASPAERPRHRVTRVVLTTLASLAAAALLLPVAANAAIGAVAAHDHGTLDIVIDGRTVDLDQERYHDLHPQFHVHEGSGNRWHHHPGGLAGIMEFEPMTLAEAFRALGMEATATSFTLHGTTFDDGEEGTSVSITVDGRPVAPTELLITDHLDIVVEVDTHA